MKKKKSNKKAEKKRSKNHKSGLYGTRAATNFIADTKRRILTQGTGTDASFSDKLIGAVNDAFEHLTRIVLRLTGKLLAMFIPGIVLICAPLLVLLILIIGACGGELDAEDEYITRKYKLASVTDATITDAVIAPDAIFVWPAIGQYYITSTFGPRWGNIHRGIDIGAPMNTKIVAGADGTVAEAAYDDSMGNYVKINHENGMQTYYMHNTTLVVAAGDKVKAGQLIAYSGTTGDSTGPHCHFGLKINGAYVNPAVYLGLPEDVGDHTDVSGIVGGD